MQWLVDSGAKTYAEMMDSISWGNYYNSTFNYTDTSGSTSTRTKNVSTIIPAGSTEYSKANNIYDMAGNVWDWTLEVRGSYFRKYRGGSCSYYSYDCPASYRSDTYPYNISNKCGFRAYFYIR